MQEIWKDIKNYEGLYQVSNLGNVKSLKRIEICGGRAKIRIRNERILRPGVDKDGYLQVGLCKNAKIKTRRVHHLVLENFLPENSQGQSSNHKNGIKSDNRVENLEWCSIQYNNQHTIDVLGKRTHENHWKSILTEKDIILIKELRNKNYTYKELSKQFGVSASHCCSIVKGRVWR